MARARHAINKNATNGQNKAAGHIRIIAGQWRGRRLPVTDVVGLRPTTDRVRETLFNWLMQEIDGARILDCFSGSGALGFEALSRYASHATLLELNNSAAQQLKKNAAALNATNAEIIQGDSLNYLSRPATSAYDVIFIDPPFRQELYLATIEQLQKHGYLAPNCWIYIESEAELAHLSVPNDWHLHRQKQTGQVLSRLYQRQA